VEIGGILIEWATASLLTVLGSTLVLVADQDIAVTFGLPDDVAVVIDGSVVDSAQARVDSASGGLVELRSPDGSAEVLVIGSQDADRVWVLEGEVRQLVLCDEPLWTEGGVLTVRSSTRPALTAWQGSWIPVPVQPETSDVTNGASSTRVAGSWRQEASAPLQRYGGTIARPGAPSAEQLTERAGIWVLGDVGVPIAGLRRTLRIDWAGDIAELLVEGVPVADRFWDGTPWSIDLDSIDGAVGPGLELRVLPLHKRTDIWLPEPARARLGSIDDALLSIDAVTLTTSSIWRAYPPDELGVTGDTRTC
jgi:beta-galactosidase